VLPSSRSRALEALNTWKAEPLSQIDEARKEPLSEAPSGRPIGRRPRRIAFLTENLGNGYTDPIFDEVVRVAQEHGIEVLCFTQGLTEVPPLNNVVADIAARECVDGILVLSLGNAVGVDDLVAYCKRYYPLPICSTTVPWLVHPTVLVDNEPGMRHGIRHLIEVHGRRRIAFVRGPEASAEAELRLRVYREVLAEHGLADDPQLVSPPGWFMIQDGSNAVRLLLEERRVRFDAFACVNDAAAMGVIQELSLRSIRVPDQVAVLGFDDIDNSPYLESPLTTVRQPVREQAREAFFVLLSQMTGGLRPAPTLLRTELVVRESCGCSTYSQDVQPVAGGSSITALAQLPDRTTIVEAMATGGASGAIAAPLAHGLYKAFVGDLSNGGDSFLRALDGALQAETRRSGDVSHFQRFVTVLQRQSADLLDTRCDAWERTSGILHAARVRISNVSERAPAMQQLRYDELCHNLSRTNRALMAADNVGALVAAMAGHLPAFGISSCYVCIYEKDAVPAEWARLALAWDANGPLRLPAEGVRFRCKEFLPEVVLPSDRSSAYVTYPLERDGVSPGYVIWSRGAQEGVVYDALQLQIGAALKKLQLLDRLVEEARRREAAERNHLEREVRVARGIQTSIVPLNVRIEGLEVAAVLLPATELSGDYYDLIPVEGGGWIGMGGVTGHGLATGLVMLMLQAAVSGLARSSPEATPSEILRLVHAILHENTQQRIAHERLASLTLLRYQSAGSLTFAGTHAHMLICRANDARVDRESPTDVPPERAVSVAQDRACDLRTGDLLVLHSDGVSGAKDSQGRAFGTERLSTAVERVRHEPVQAICQALVAELRDWMTVQQDDITLIVARQTGTPRGAERAP
jgi:phosphoserine phosphatase RsbU/P